MVMKCNELIKKITINDFIPFKKGSVLELAQINLFVGKNGSGKSRLLTELARCMANRRNDNKTLDIDKDTPDPHEKFFRYVKEDRSPEIRDMNLTTPIDTSWNNLRPQEPFSNFTLDSEMINNFNKIFSEDFNRYLKISKEIGKGEHATYTKNGIGISPNEDGFGLSNIVYLYQFPYLAPKDSTVVIEEPTVGLYPALSDLLLDTFTELAIDNGIQMIYTSHDVFTMLYFLSKRSEHEEFRIFRFTDDGEITIKSFEIKETNDFLNDFFGSFPSVGQIKILKDFLKTFDAR